MFAMLNMLNLFIQFVKIILISVIILISEAVGERSTRMCNAVEPLVANFNSLQLHQAFLYSKTVALHNQTVLIFIFK